MSLVAILFSPTDKSLDADIFPKPKIFFPSLAEIKFHMSGTYICLLENFFPKVIKIHWKEKDGKTILKSQQGDTMKTKDTYMKFSWLTVARESLAKEQKCIITQESNKGGIDEEIVFRSMKKGMSTLQLQLKTTSARYTYLLLYFKSLIYSTIITIHLFGRPALGGNGKSS
uniref:Immunoglobulin C1-set domain-containing protein n=1 Tax=Neovison vison TaxID=452646 RepID=A0A8C7AHF4_NEOVI